MRPALSILFVVLALLTAGCASPGEDAGDGATSTPLPTTPEEGPDADNTTSRDGANETTDDAAGNETQEPAPEPAEVYATSYGYPTSASTESEPHIEPFEVPEGYTQLFVNVTFSPSTSAGVVGAGYATGIRVALVDPNDTEASDACTLEGPVTEASECAFAAPVSAAGVWSLLFEGSGAVSATVTVEAA